MKIIFSFVLMLLSFNMFAYEPVRTKSSVDKSLDQVKGAFYMYYKARLKEVPGLEGSTNLSFTILSDGTAVKCKFTGGTLNDDVLHSKMCSKIESTKFNSVSSNVPFVYEATFGFTATGR